MRGDKKAAARIDHIAPESVTAIRSSLKLSQHAFASAFGISVATLRNWEQGRRQHRAACCAVCFSRRGETSKGGMEAVR